MPLPKTSEVQVSKADKLNKRAEELLQELDKTTDQIAELLKDKGVTGDRLQINSCVIAKFFTQELEKIDPKVRVFSGSDVAHILNDDYIVPGTKTLHFPDNIKNFIREFDAGNYPDLITQPERLKLPTPLIKEEKESTEETTEHTE